MKNFTKLTLILSMLFGIVGGVSSVKAEKTSANISVAINATWDSGANTMGWTSTSDSWGAFSILNTGLPSGNITAYTKFHATLADFSENADYIRLRIKDKSNHYADCNLVVGENNIDLAALATDNPSCDFTDIVDITFWGSTSATEDHTIDNDHPASVVITDCYMYMLPTLIFDAYGKATTSKEDLSATGGLSYNSETGVVTSDGTAGELKLEFAEPVDLKYLNYFNVKRSGTDDIIDRLYFYDEDGTEIYNWGYTKFDNTWRTPAPGCDDNATNAFLNHNPVKKLVWKAVDKAENEGKTLTINSIEWTLKTISCAKAGETQLKTLPWNKIDGSGTATPNWNMNNTSDTYYGDFSGDPTHYADLTDYSELRVYCKSNSDGFRAFFIKADASGTNAVSTSSATWHATEKYYSIDLSSVTKWAKAGTDGIVALKSIKSDPWSGTTTGQNVTDIEVYKTPVANAPQYTLTGSGMQLATTVAALADATATCIDATGVIGNTTNSVAGQTLLTSANPNCLFLGTTGNGGLANTKNVISSGTCANLVLTDGYPFKAPAAFTATGASYDRTIAAGTTTTVCLPFALTQAECEAIGTFYELKGLNGDGSKLQFEEVSKTEAGKPYLVVNTSGAPKTFTSLSGDKSVVAGDAITVDGTNSDDTQFIGTLASTLVKSVAEGDTYYGLNNGTFVKAGTSGGFTLPAFRGYVKVSGGGAARLGISFINDEVTGIKSVANSQEKKSGSQYFDLQGRRVSKPVKGLYVVNGKKMVIK